MSQNVGTFFLRKNNNVFNLGARKLDFEKYIENLFFVEKLYLIFPGWIF